MRKRNADQPDEDLVVWERVTSNVKPIRSARFAAQKHDPDAKSSSSKQKAVKSAKPKSSGAKGMAKGVANVSASKTPSRNGLGALAQPVSSTPPVTPVDLRTGEHAGLDKSTRRKLFRGDVPVTRQLDLHGMTAAQAEMRLTGFIQESAHNGHRCVLVITGKGVRGDGVLRRHVPLWFKNHNLAGLILAFAEARPADGGSGALYVLLRRRRGEASHDRKGIS
ncbi:Smr/MutS family protein [Alphaproteobacteria bacterium]|nr:Smr/MutS family protein [Alphaproteobacteria bacterium]